MKQAVVLIHGMGEQVPMDTLRGFAEAVWTTDQSLRNEYVADQTWSKPDEISGDFELRRLTTAEDRNGRRTDFFEFYWAHLMEGTTLSHVGAWARVLVFRLPWRLPAQWRMLWCLLAAIFFSGLVTACLNLDWFTDFENLPGWATLAWVVVQAALLGFLINILGDAARYLHVAPSNIAIRRSVREAGVDLLDKLHKSGKYDRIIVVGHSLGSVIGYDILTHYWARKDFHGLEPVDKARRGPALSELEQMVAPEDNLRIPTLFEVKRYQEAQSRYFQELKKQGANWLVTDFVTLGSPLAHAQVLLARNEQEFATKQREREYPTAPPVLERIQGHSRFTYDREKTWTPHHAAPFAVTRWTNVYFPCRFTFWGDLIGGPVEPAFGPGVHDIKAETTVRGNFFAHTSYWDFPKYHKPQSPTPSWIADLRRAVRITPS